MLGVEGGMVSLREFGVAYFATVLMITIAWWDPYWWLSLGLSVVSYACIIALVLWHERRERREGRQDDAPRAPPPGWWRERR